MLGKVSIHIEIETQAIVFNTREVNKIKLCLDLIKYQKKERNKKESQIHLFSLLYKFEEKWTM